MSRKALGYHFFIIDNKFILHFDREVYRKFYPIIDLASFEIINSNGSTFHYFRDKNRVYIDSYMNTFTVLPGADPADFRVLDFENGKSTSGVSDYLFNQQLPHRFTAYEPLSGLYQRVANKIYFNYSKEVAGADVTTFEVLHGDKIGNVARDNNQVYFREQIVEEADAETFQFLEECFNDTYYRECDHTFYGKDKNYGYYIDTIAPAFKIIKTPNTNQFHFRVIGELGYAFDEKYQYLFGKRKRV